MDIAGHVSRQMLKHYSHIRMEAKREALDAVFKKQQAAKNRKGDGEMPTQEIPLLRAVANENEAESL